MIMMRVTTTVLKMIVMLGCCKLIVWVSQDYDMQVFNIIVDDNDEVDNYDDEDDVGEDFSSNNIYSILERILV